MDNNPQGVSTSPQAVGHIPHAIDDNAQVMSNEVSATPAKSRKTTSFAGSEIVTVLVGQDEVKYYLHKDKLTSGCPFFAACLASGMKETQTNEVKLPEDDVKTFDCFVDWIYAEALPNISVGEPVISTMEAWILAEKLCMPKWQNALIDHIAHIFTNTPVMEASQLFWINKNAPVSSNLFRFVMDHFSYELAKNTTAYQKKLDTGGLVFDKPLWFAMTKSPVGNHLISRVITIARNPKASNPKHKPQDYHIPLLLA